MVGGYHEIATDTSCADVCAVAKLTVVWATQAGVPLSRVVPHRAALSTLPLVQKAFPAIFIDSTGGTAGRLISLAFLAGVVAEMALVHKFKFA